MRKLASLVALMALAVSCGGGAESPGASDDAAVGDSAGGGDNTELVVFGPSVIDRLAGQNEPEVQEAVEQEVLEGFASEHPSVMQVTWPAEGPGSDSNRRMLSAFLAGEDMDLIACGANNLNQTYIRRGIVRDITEEIEPFKDRFLESGLAGYTSAGRVYGIPISAMATSTFYYNMDLFEELGATPPETYEEFVALSSMLDEAGYIPVLHQGGIEYMWPMWYFEAAAQTMDDSIEKAISNLKGETKYTDEEDVAALDSIKQFVEDGIISPDSLGTDDDGMKTAFATERSAMYYGGTWELAWIESTPEFEVGVFPYPTLPDGVSPPAHGGGPSTGLCISSNISDEKLPYAIDFLEYMTRPEVANVYIAPTNPVESAIVGVDVSDTDIANSLRENHYPNTIKFLDWIWPAEVADAYGQTIQGIVGGEVEPAEAAERIQGVYDGLVDEGYAYDE
jgi:raffinose/stachyose/melibiose transport system substrate-binding protein